MAKKTTTLAEKTYTLTQEQFQQLRDFSTDFMNIRRTLDDLEGEENISTIMFKVGKAFNIADVAETGFDSFLDQFEEKCDECDEEDSW